MRSGALIRQQRLAVTVLACAAALVGRWAAADYDPPANYYSAATGTGDTLRSQLHGIISTGTSTRTYDQLRTDLQVTDVDPNNSARIMLVYNNRQSVLKPTGGSIPGWDMGATWNREHSWPQSRGVDGTGTPDGSDMHHLFPCDEDENNRRGNRNFGGAFGAQGFGQIDTDGGLKYYPGDLDAGMIARAQFYMDVRYEGGESGTEDLELADEDPFDGGTTLGDLKRLIEWHFAAPPDSFERRRNHLIDTMYQHNRNPFIDHPEYVWSAFQETNNNSQIAISGATVNANGSSTKNIDLGRVFVNGSVPGQQSVTLNKNGLDGTYYEVSASGAATSTVTGRLNAFRTNMIDSKSFNVGLNTTTTAAGLKSGTVTIDNLDITGAAGSGHGAGDANDTINLSLTVLNHATPSLAGGTTVTSVTHNFGTVAMGSAAPPFYFYLFNRSTTPGFTADLDFDSVMGSGGAAALAALTTNLAESAGSLSLDGGDSHQFTAMLNTSAVGSFSAIYTLTLSDENLPQATTNMKLFLTLSGQVLLAGDYNRDGLVDAADYVVWRGTYGTSVMPFEGADGDGSGTIGDEDYPVWMAHFGETSGPAAGAGASLAAVPEPASFVLALMGGFAWLGLVIYPVRSKRLSGN